MCTGPSSGLEQQAGGVNFLVGFIESTLIICSYVCFIRIFLAASLVESKAGSTVWRDW
jgi:hypothetical protein